MGSEELPAQESEAPPRVAAEEAGSGGAAAAAVSSDGSSTGADAGSTSSSATTSGEQLPELPLYSCKEAYVYRVPSATTVGHRAETWDVNNWLATVAVRVVQDDDDAYVRLLDIATGDLFAECPVPTDKPLVTAVEPVIDSSRYFVLRIADRDSQRHAFIGIGFRERNEASGFNEALHDYLQYIKRKRTAQAMRHAYEERLQSADIVAGDAAAGAAMPHADYSIKEGETLTLKIKGASSSPQSGGSSRSSRGGGSGGGFVSGRRAIQGQLGKSFSLIMDGNGGSVAALSPPPGCSPKAQMSVSPSVRAGGGSPNDSFAGGLAPLPHGRLSMEGGRPELQQQLQGLQLQDQQQAGSGSGSGSISAASSTATAAAAAPGDEEDDFGEFAVAEGQADAVTV